MGDETVSIVAAALVNAAFANGVSDGQTHALADVVVNRLRDWGMYDWQIRLAFLDEATPSRQPMATEKTT